MISIMKLRYGRRRLAKLAGWSTRVLAARSRRYLHLPAEQVEGARAGVQNEGEGPPRERRERPHFLLHTMRKATNKIA